MIYAYLSSTMDGWDKLKIIEFHYTQQSIVFTYVFFNDSTESLKERVEIRKQSDISKIINERSLFLHAYETIEKALIQYLIDNKVISATIEVI